MNKFKKFVGLWLLLGCFNGASAAVSCGELLPSATDPQRPGLILIAEHIGYQLNNRALNEIQTQIIEHLPEEVPVLKIKAHSPWIRDWFPLVIPGEVEGTWRYIQFQPQTPHGAASARLLRQVLESAGISIEQVPAFFDGGNGVSDGKRLFVSRSEHWLTNNSSTGITPSDFHLLVKEKLALETVWLPELPFEPTGHVDIFLTYVGKNRFVVADSRNPARKAALDEAAKILEGLGYRVTRVMNGFSDDRRRVYSYTNSLIVGDRALVPVYSNYVKEKLLAKPGRRLWWQLLSLMNSRVAKEQLSRDEFIEQRFIQDDLAALKAFADLGLEVYPIVMNGILDSDGMVHCLTRTLPQGFYDKEIFTLPEGLRVMPLGRYGF